ncbi:thiol:disulfide interchange protein DsbC [Luteibacter sp. OK325]|jgi:thiol:disulfide interchange protein DsbC|uniref:DsbC family protein n=1 Tax=Luteibacter sp. OK325 TaxID=2135670 RepID=UPI000D33B39B|nr:DsbC family protein [Luteibacter sp. OK325]PTR22434.1 thiol:disulfide interchange protein DsbC [Luteibacter sp. OK325]
MFKKILPAILAGAFAMTASAADDQAAVRAAVEGIGPGIEVQSIAPAPIPGYYQVIASGRMVYVSADGHYMLNGNLVDLQKKTDLSAAAWSGLRKTELAKVPESQRLVYSPANPKHKITVFTDVDCGFCRQLHAHINEFNKQGIAVEYVFWPREGVKTTAGNDTPSYTKAVSVWCAADRKSAFDSAMSGAAVKAASCANPVKDEFELGERLGVNGTPTIVNENGDVIGGYLTPEQMLKALSAPAGSARNG